MTHDDMSLTMLSRDFSQTIRARSRRDVNFRRCLVAEARSQDDPAIAKQLYLDAGFDFTGNSVWDKSIHHHIVSSNMVAEIVANAPSLNDTRGYPDDFLGWIGSSRLNRFTGLERFEHRYIALGTTQAMDEFHQWCRVSGRRLRVFRGEYPYHQTVVEGFVPNDFLDDAPLRAEDAVIISLPFSGHGGKHAHMDKLLDRAAELAVPVLVDAAWFGCCHGLTFDFNHPAIAAVAFSTSKGLNCGNWRSGVTFSRIVLPRLAAHTQWGHSVHLNIQIARRLMRDFTPDHIPTQFRSTQERVCADHGLTPSPTVHVAVGDGSWSLFSRDGAVNRINLRNLLK